MEFFVLTSDISHIGPFVFTHHLLPLLKETASVVGSDVRIVNVSHSHARDLETALDCYLAGFFLGSSIC